MTDKRERGKNFSTDEECRLVELVEKHLDVIGDPRADSATWRRKQQKWLEISMLFNSGELEPRSAKTLKDKYRNMKRITRSSILSPQKSQSGSPIPRESTFSESTELHNNQEDEEVAEEGQGEREEDQEDNDSWSLDCDIKMENQSQVSQLSLFEDNSKRRDKNFTPEEEQLLMQVVKEHTDVIDNQKSASDVWRAKQQIWLNITTRMNREYGWNRTVDTLRIKYQNLKAIAKRKLQSNNQQENPPVVKRTQLPAQQLQQQQQQPIKAKIVPVIRKLPPPVIERKPKIPRVSIEVDPLLNAEPVAAPTTFSPNHSDESSDEEEEGTEKKQFHFARENIKREQKIHELTVEKLTMELRYMRQKHALDIRQMREKHELEMENMQELHRRQLESVDVKNDNFKATTVRRRLDALEAFITAQRMRRDSLVLD